MTQCHRYRRFNTSDGYMKHELAIRQRKEVSEWFPISPLDFLLQDGWNLSKVYCYKKAIPE